MKTNQGKQLKNGRRQPESGAAMVEFALVVPLFLMLAIGVLEVGRAWFQYNLLTYAVREGARLAIVEPDLGFNDSRVLDRIEEVLETGGLVAVDTSLEYETPLVIGRLLTIEAEVIFRPVVAAFWDTAAIPLTAMTVTRYEASNEAS